MYCSLVKHSVFSIVKQAVGDHEVEISLQVSDRAIFVSFQFGFYCGEVHGVRDKLQVIWDLRSQEHIFCSRLEASVFNIRIDCYLKNLNGSISLKLLY